MQPCIRAHKAPTSSVYTAQLRLERQAAGTAVAIFAGERTPGHEAFEACAVKAINGAAIAIPQTTTLPVAFDFGPELRSRAKPTQKRYSRPTEIVGPYDVADAPHGTVAL